ncbi:MAG: thiamine biosynthesis protein ThiS [Leptolyngbya sp.]|jgi:sulfur carrier protein|uniref:Thiamine biosynthesis protein ThiS n=1 Tax=Shackletoniella antarctica TaxID=268115 RepID=A0A2W4YBL4_9CYAN|nr:MAG: thiamine biosynthesis protein ThiS [Shackletoniella antarctica]PZV16754.1 MAG: thiamine biosynthesis protein ThiS [Leptolyngbya sp.]
MQDPTQDPTQDSTTDRFYVLVNGESRPCTAETLLPAYLAVLGLNPRLVAVEYNGEILHRQLWETTHLRPDDRLEIVTIVGGG